MSCDNSNVVSLGNNGRDGRSAYIYLAYADNVVTGSPDTVTNYSYGTPQTTSEWISFITTDFVLTPIESNFQGKWVKIKGEMPSPAALNIYNTDGLIEDNRTILGGTNNITFQNFYDFLLSSTNTLVLTNPSFPSTTITLNPNLIQFNSGGGEWYSYGDNFSVLANNLMYLDCGSSGRIGTSAGGYVARVYFDNGVLTLDGSSNIFISSSGVVKYKLPLTTPTTGQVLTALDDFGTLGWV